MKCETLETIAVICMIWGGIVDISQHINSVSHLSSFYKSILIQDLNLPDSVPIQFCRCFVISKYIMYD